MILLAFYVGMGIGLWTRGALVGHYAGAPKHIQLVEAVLWPIMLPLELYVVWLEGQE